MHAMPAQKRLLIVANSVENTFRYLVIEPMVTRPTSLNNYSAEEHAIDWPLFGKIDKVYFFKHVSDIICAEVVKSTKT